MSDVVAGASFALTSEYVNASGGFTNSQEIIVYVEGFADVNFWKKCIKKHIQNVRIVAYGQDGIANGKGTIISAIKRGDIVLGSNLVVALDSDYDYLLNNNRDIFNQYCVFQTYAYSIENLIWHPNHLDEVCQEASNDTRYCSENAIKIGFENWSKAVYPEFLKFLKSGTLDEVSINRILDSINYENIHSDCSHINFPNFNDQAFIDEMYSKGLDEKNVHLFVRGHNFEEKIAPLCENVVEKVLDNVAVDIQKSKKASAVGQMISEYVNSRHKPRHIALGKDIQCAFSIPRIMVDIALFKNSYLKDKAPVVFKQITTS